MKYSYYCDKCNKEKEIIKPLSEYDKKEICECGKTMRKVFSISSILTKDGVKL